MLSIDVPLTLTTMVTVPLVGLTATRMQRALFPASWLIQARLAEVATVVDESIAGVAVVRAFAAEKREIAALQRAGQRLAWAYVKDADIRARYAPLVQNLSQVGMVAVLLVGGHEVVAGQLGVGAILAFAAYLLLLQTPFQMLGSLVMLGQRAAASAGRVYELLDEEPSVRDSADAEDLVVTDGVVAFESVTFGYANGKTPVLESFDMQLRRGETVALVGRTGSGKSTVARLLTRLYDVQDGRVVIDGIDVRSVTLTSVRAAVGVVTDEPFLFSASIRDNIAYGAPGASDERIKAAARTAGADEFIRGLAHGYDTVVGERGYTLSGGQRQRIALARTILSDPPILVLDDATSSLDVQVESDVQAALAERLVDRTVLVIAHRLSTISTADRVVVLDGGKVVAHGRHEELLETSSAYRDVLTHVRAHEPDPAASGPGSAVAGDSDSLVDGFGDGLNGGMRQELLP
jgi:ATP-binding cassette subfamily B protein